jgi:AraC-like DNA-binding protein
LITFTPLAEQVKSETSLNRRVSRASKDLHRLFGNGPSILILTRINAARDLWKRGRTVSDIARRLGFKTQPFHPTLQTSPRLYAQSIPEVLRVARKGGKRAEGALVVYR